MKKQLWFFFVTVLVAICAASGTAMAQGPCNQLPQNSPEKAVCCAYAAEQEYVLCINNVPNYYDTCFHESHYYCFLPCMSFCDTLTDPTAIWMCEYNYGPMCAQTCNDFIYQCMWTYTEMYLDTCPAQVDAFTNYCLQN